MKTNIINYQTGFDEKFKDLEECILQAYQFFMWYGSKSKSRRDELRSILFLECLFLQMLKDMKELFTMRCMDICDELTDKFKDLLVLMNDQMHQGTSYIRVSSKCLESDLLTDGPFVTGMRSDLVEGFDGLSVWLKETIEQPLYMERIKMLIDELGLNYQKRMIGCIGDNFEQHTNMVMNALMLLAIPSHVDASYDEFTELFKSSFTAFCNSSHCKEELEDLSSKIEDDFSAKDVAAREQKIVRLKQLWGEKKVEIRSYLEQFGIRYINVNSDSNKGRLGRKLYDVLNADGNGDCKKMSNDKLHHYFLMEAQLAFLTAEIERQKVVVDDPTPGKEFFSEKVKRSDLRQALYKTVYEEQGLNKMGEKRYVLGAQGHWLAVLKVMQTYDMVRGTMNDFSELMKVWFPMAPHPCDYRSMISVRAFEVKTKPYPEWSKLDKVNYAYLRVADTFVKYLREYELI